MNTPHHEQIRRLLAHYHELDSIERQQVDLHLAGCAECRAIRAAYEQQNLVLRALPSRTPTTQVYRNLTAEISRRQTARPWYRRMPAELAFVAAAAVLLLGFFSLIRLQNAPQETAARTVTPDAQMVAVSETQEPAVTPNPPPPAAIAITTTLPLTPSDALSGTALAGSLPWMTVAIDTAGGTSVVTTRADGTVANPPHSFEPTLRAAPRVSPDGQWTAVGHNGVTLLPATGDAPVALLAPDVLSGTVTALAWAPDSSALAMTIRRPDGLYQVSTVRLEAGLPVESFEFDQGYPHLLGWEASGQQVVVLLSADEETLSSGQIQVLAAGQAPVVQPYSYAAAPGRTLRQPTLGPRGRWVYYLADQPGGGSILVRQSLRDGSQTVALSATLPIDSYDLADDENHVAYTLTPPSATTPARSDVRLLTFSSGRPVALASLPDSPTTVLAWSPAMTSPLDSWIVLEQPAVDTKGPRLTLLRPSDGISLPVTIEGLAETTAPNVRLAGWSQPLRATDAAIDETDLLQVTRAISQTLAGQQWPALARWIGAETFTRCQYGGSCTSAVSPADALMTLAGAFRDGDSRVEAERQVMEPPGFVAPGEAVLLIRRTPAVADVDSSHLYLRRSEDGRWRLSGIQTGIPYYDAPSLAEVRAAPAAFAGLEVVLEGEYFVTNLPADLPGDAPRLGEWVLRDASGASLWVRNDTPELGQDITEGGSVQVLGVLKVEQGWPFLQVSLVRPSTPDGGS